MEIDFQDRKLEKICNSDTLLLKVFGKVNAKKIKMRLDDLRAAQKLADVAHLPGQYHNLSGNRKGQIAVHINEPYRLLFKPNHDPVPVTVSGNIDWEKITCITIIEVTNYHGK